MIRRVRGWLVRWRRRNWKTPEVSIRYREGIDVSFFPDRLTWSIENNLFPHGVELRGRRRVYLIAEFDRMPAAFEEGRLPR